jgi:hypothetical protein
LDPIEPQATDADIDVLIEKKNEPTVESKELSKATYIKDKFNISDATFQNLINHLGLKFSLRKIRNFKKSLNDMILVKENEYGFYINIRQKLKMILKILKYQN